MIPDYYDGIWDSDGVGYRLLDPVLLDFSEHRGAMKIKYFGELFPVLLNVASGQHFADFFCTDRNGVEKGLVRIKLERS